MLKKRFGRQTEGQRGQRTGRKDESTNYT
jgi:hypothetical protein